MIAWGVEALLASTALIVLALIARAPVRRAFGPQVAYLLWALPALRLALPPLPADWLHATPAPLAAAGERVMVLVLPAAPVADVSSPPIGLALVAIWGIGAALVLGWHIVAYRRFARRVAASGVPFGRIGRVALVESEAVADPLAYGVARPVVAVPRDFRSRYAPRECQLALAHEVAHHARGDMLANWVALLVLALHWFDPLAWIAFRAFRADQEMATDAHVLARRGIGVRHAYGCALAKAAGVQPIPAPIPAAACGLITADDLKGRLRMLAKPTSRTRRIAGAATIASATLALLGLTASGSDAAETVRAQVEQATGVPLATLAPTALFQEAPHPPAPPGPTAPGSGGRHVATVRDNGAVHVTVTEHGRTRHYAGAEAEAWLAANPQPVPPVPPVPPAAPVSEMQAVRAEAQAARIEAQVAEARRTAPQVISGDCRREPDGSLSAPSMTVTRVDGDRRTVVVCTDRIEAAARQAAAASRRAQLASVDADRLRRDAIARALDGLRRTRAAWARGDGPAAVPASARADALRNIDATIAGLEKQVAARD